MKSSLLVRDSRRMINVFENFIHFYLKCQNFIHRKLYYFHLRTKYCYCITLIAEAVKIFLYLYRKKISHDNKSWAKTIFEYKIQFLIKASRDINVNVQYYAREKQSSVTANAHHRASWLRNYISTPIRHFVFNTRDITTVLPAISVYFSVCVLLIFTKRRRGKKSFFFLLTTSRYNSSL